MMSKMSGSCGGLGLVAVCLLALGACNEAPRTNTETGSLSGLAIISGPLAGAQVSVDQVKLDARGEVSIREHVGDATTDSEGRFSLDTGVYNGLFIVTANGGSYTERLGGATVQLDPTDGLESIAWLDLLERRDDVLVSPVGHLIAARMRSQVGELGDVTDAAQEAASVMQRHFANVDWTRILPGSLDVPAVSPTEAVRAALVQVSLSVLASDIANQAGASPQEVNVYTLTAQLAADLSDGVFDGNDGNSDVQGAGLQVGVCPPLADCQAPASGCALGACRTQCDLYANTVRALLAGEMTKVIYDNGPGGLNQTKLSVADILPIARSVADNIDESLFGNACRDTLDRIAPIVTFQEPIEGQAYRGIVAARATAVDDTDSSPRVTLVGYDDVDGDSTNPSAQAAIDTADVADGRLVIQAQARDLAGNMTMANRAVVVDNTRPEVALSAAGYFPDGATWWTTSAAPVLAGTATDLTTLSIKAVVGGVDVPGTVTGGGFSIALPPGAIAVGGTDVTIVATDAAGNTRSIVQHLRPDTTAPELSFQASTVNDEAAEVVTFDETTFAPVHAHTGAAIDLGSAGACPTLTKHSYLLRSTAPTYGVENPGPNPIRYQLLASDPGVGLDAGSTQYRVGFRNGTTTQWVLDWTSAGAGTVLGAGVTRYAVGLYSDVLASLATTEGTYDVEFRVRDRLARTSTIARCFDLRIKAPPLQFGAGGSAAGHTYALNSLTLAAGAPAPFEKLAGRLLNNDATGASLLDQDITNGTGETVYLTVEVDKPDLVIARQRFKIGYFLRNPLPAQFVCSVEDGGCPHPDVTTTVEQSTNHPALTYPVRLFEVVGGVPATEIPCLAPCLPTGATFKFAIPPRAAGSPPRRFKAMTMIGQVQGLWPRTAQLPAAPPFLDTSVDGRTITGLVAASGQRYCSRAIVTGHDPDTGEPNQLTCTQTSEHVQYRALLSASLEFDSDTGSRYGTTATPLLVPVLGPTRLRDESLGWSTVEGPLP